MDAKTYLTIYSQNLEIVKNKFFKEKIKEASQVDSLAVTALKILSNYMQGGKNARGALTLMGYKIADGKNEEEIMKASFAVELIHNSLLIHDDFIDKDMVRRGKPTVHEIFKNTKNDSHYGASMAIITADLGLFWAHQIMADLNLSKDKVTSAISKFDELLLNTGYGELLDIDFDSKKNLTWEDILKVRIYKTSHYTFVMPLQVGAILGGGDGKLLNCLKNFGEPIGLAFQIQDDILGVFGDSNETGKSTDNDIKEGKKTLLYFKALEFANKKDKQILKKYYGNISNKKEILEIKRIIKNTKALDFSRQASFQFVENGKKVIPEITKDKNLQNTLSSLADYILQREK